MAIATNGARPRASKAAPPPLKTAAPKAAAKPRKTAKASAAPTPPPPPPPGWYPINESSQRFWDGSAWMGGAVPIASVPTEAPADVSEHPSTTRAAESIVFRGRTMRVHSLSLAHIGVWQRIAKTFIAQNAEPVPANETATQLKLRNDRVAKSLDRCLEIVLSVLVDEHDIEWVETSMMRQQLDLDEASQIVSLTVEAFTASRKAAAPATGPAPKARRR